MRATPKKCKKKTWNGNLLVKVNSKRQAENILKNKSFYTTKCRAYPHERLNTSKNVIGSRELAGATADEMSATLGKQGVTNIRRITIKKGKEQIQTNTYILTFNQPQRKWKSIIVSRGLSNMSQNPWCASYAKNMDTTRKLADDDRHGLSVVKRPRSHWRKIV